MRYRRRPPEVLALQWDGTEEDADLIARAFPSAHMHHDGSAFHVLGFYGIAVLAPGDWVVLEQGKGIRVFADPQFRTKFEAV